VVDCKSLDVVCIRGMASDLSASDVRDAVRQSLAKDHNRSNNEAHGKLIVGTGGICHALDLHVHK